MIKITVYSNFLESLLKNLKKNLFEEYLNFKHYIFIPNKFVKMWLMKKFCDDKCLRSCFDIKFINFSNFLNFIQNAIGIYKEKRFLNFLELNITIRNKILYSIKQNNLDKIIINYLIKNEKIVEKRLSKLCEELTESFLNYSVFGNFDDLNNKRKTSWQAKLFYEIFYIDSQLIAYRDLKNLNITSIKNYFFHFFAINYIPPLYFDFIDKFSNVFHYIKSPCNVFWEDISSDYERHILKKYWMLKKKSIQKIDELDSYLKEKNSFLANMEKLKKSYFSTISNYEDYYLLEEYFEKPNINFLNHFQNDILKLKTTNQDNYGVINKKDSSFQIHIAPNKFREIQILHSNILNILSENSKYELSDIHVLAPNINKYIPYIHMIFNDNENSLNYKILEFSFVETSHLISGIDKLFSLAKNKWEKADILGLLENPLFQKIVKITNEEKIELFNLLEKAKISFGINEENISESLKNSSLLHFFKQKCFDKGLARILFGMVYILKDDFSNDLFPYEFPVDQLEMSKTVVIINKFLNIFCSIIEDLKIIENNVLLSLSEWRKYFHKIINKYFLICENNIEKSSYDLFNNFLEDLRKVEFRFKKHTYSFETIYDYLRKYIKRGKADYNKNNENAISFSSFDLALLPAKAIFIIGMDSESIKFYSKNSIDINNSLPTQNDLERSLFLEAMLSAKEYLILSYPSSENYLTETNIILQELLFYLDNSYRIEGQKPTDCFINKHPAFSFDKKYFTEKVTSFSKIDNMAAKSFYLNEKKTQRFVKSNNHKLPENVDINNLRVLGNNPIKFYLNKVLNLYLDNEKKRNEFNFSYLDKYLINKASLQCKIENILSIYEKKANVPLGIYYEIEKEKIIDEYNRFNEKIKHLGIDLTKLVTVEFDLDIDKKIQINENLIKFPSILIKVNGKNIKLYGKLENISDQGLFIFSDDKPTNIIRKWINILLFCCLDNSFSKQIIFSKNLKMKSFNIDNVNKYLSHYVNYYFQCLNEPSFMIKPFIEYILKKDEKGLSKAIDKICENKITLDIYAKWYLLNSKKLEAREIINNWSDNIQKIFKPIMEEI